MIEINQNSSKKQNKKQKMTYEDLGGQTAKPDFSFNINK